MHAAVTTPDHVAPSAAPLPTPIVDRGLPVLGSLPDLLRDAPATLLDAARRHPGDLFALKLGPVQIPVVCHPDHVHETLVSRAGDFQKAGMWEAVRPLLGNGLVTSDGDFWKRQRRLLQPLFSRAHLGSLAEAMIDAIGAQLDDVASQGGEAVDVGAEMTLITQRVLMETIFGESLDPTEARALGGHLDTAFKAMNSRLFLYWLPGWVPRPGDRAFFGAIKAIDATLARLVAERRAHPTDNIDILNRLLGAEDADTGEKMTDAQIRDELITLFVAGLDTTAVTLTWTLWLLDEHPEWDAAVRAEIAAVFGDSRPDPAKLMQLSTVTQVLSEAMRLYPPAWMFPRYTPEGTVIGGRQIAPGTTLLVSPYVTHRDPAFWDNPDQFDPGRFSAERSAGRPRMAFIPFGAGPRQCLGSHFAMMEAQLALVLLCQRFRPVTVPGQEIVPAAASTLHPKNGLKMTFTPAL